MEAAKSFTGIDNETEAITEFRAKLDSPDNYYNQDEFPANESDNQAYKRCSTIEGAKKYCPMRWKAMQRWFVDARAVRIAWNSPSFTIVQLEIRQISEEHHAMGIDIVLKMKHHS